MRLATSVRAAPCARRVALAAAGAGAGAGGRPTPRRILPHCATWSPAAGVRALTAARAAPSAATVAPAAGSVPTTNVVRLLRERGLLNDVAGDGLEELADKEFLPVYCGFDPTAESLHLGNLLGIIVLTWFRRCGHAPVALLGGATGRVGDPSGRSAERPVLDEAALDANVAGIRAILEDLLGRQGVADGGPAPVILNNLDWFAGVGLLDFLRDVGKHARVGAMLSRDSVRNRMEGDGDGISFTEFTYQLLQGYDFVHLAREHGVRVQIGGSDQMGNMIAGLDLLRRTASPGGPPPPPAFGLTFPLLTKADGTKMGKSAGGAVWLAPTALSPFKFYQYLLTSVSDDEVVRFLRMLTFLPLTEIDSVEAAMAAGPAGGYAPNTAQRLLAAEVTRFVHGEDGLRQALAATDALRPGADTALDVETLEAAAGDAPTASMPRENVVGAALADVMAAVGLQPSKAAVRRLIKGGGVRVNNAKVDDEAAVLGEGDLVGGRLVLLAAGKKNKLLLRVEG